MQENSNRCAHCGQLPGGEVAAWMSKKVPIGFLSGNTVDYAMKEVGLSFRTTVASDDPRALRRAGEQLWLELEDAIDAQIRRGAGDHGRLGIQQRTAPPAEAGPRPPAAAGNGPGNGRPQPTPSGDRVRGGATVKTINFLVKIARDRGADLGRVLQETFGKENVQDLSQKEASHILQNVFNIQNNKARR